MSNHSTSLISCSYPGGNIVIDREEPGHLWLSPDFRHMQKGHSWFYWSFRAENRTPLTVIFSHRNHIAAHGPAISRDGGRSWEWTGANSVRVKRIREHVSEWSFDIPPVAEGEDIRYAFCPQYQQSHLEQWLQRHADNPSLSTSTLCTSRNGRPVEVVHVGDPSSDLPIIWLCARHHCCETLASYAIEGFLEASLANDELGKRLRSSHRIMAIPFVDKDGVEEGDQGKLRHPHDHNRDYNQHPIYPEIAAIMQFGAKHRQSIAAFLDLHGPMVHGPWDNHFYLVGSEIPEVSAKQDAFAEAFRQTQSGPIPIYPDAPVLHFGEAWNTGDNFCKGLHATGWASAFFQDAEVVTSFEIPYANSTEVEVNPKSARLLGRDLAVALDRYLNGNQS